jgi:protein transport protein SEC31
LRAFRSPSESLIFRNTEHTGSVRALEFNPLQKHLLASGGANGEIYVWDLKDPSKPYQPGARSSKLDEVTALSWNHQVAHVLGTSSSSGYTIVWDLRGKREVTALQYGGGAGTTGGSTVYQGGGVLAVGSRRGMSAIAWHPENVS